MPVTPGPLVWLLLVAALHLGFQATVSVLVYPALAEAPEERWARVHAAHSRRITPLVAASYLPLLGVLVWSVLSFPTDPGVLVAAAGAALSFLITATVAAPLHGRLAAGRRDDLVRRLLVADRVRVVGAVICVLGALVAL